MSVGLITLIVLGLAVLGVVYGRRRALSAVEGDARHLHSLPSYYGWSVFLFTAVPSLLLMCAWLILQPSIIENRVAALVPEADIAAAGSLNLVMADVRRIAGGLDAMAKQAGLEGILAGIQPAPSPAETVAMPPSEPTDEEIQGIDVLSIEDGVKALWKEGIYAESSMGCTGPVIKLPARHREKGEELLKDKGYI